MRKTFGLCPKITRISAVPINVLEFNITVVFFTENAPAKTCFLLGFLLVAVSPIQHYGYSVALGERLIARLTERLTYIGQLLFNITITQH